jgi:hypothetical protein
VFVIYIAQDPRSWLVIPLATIQTVPRVLSPWHSQALEPILAALNLPLWLQPVFWALEY